MTTPTRLTQEQIEQLRNLDAFTGHSEAAAAHSPLFKQLASIDRTLLKQIIEICNYQPGEVIFTEGAPGDAMYLIRAGRLAVIKGDLDAPTPIGFRGPGEVVGEMALLEDAPRSATLVTLEPLSLLRIRRDDFRALLNHHPPVAMNIMATLSERLRASDNTLSANAQQSKQLSQQVVQLRGEREQLLEIQRVRQETSDLIIHDLRNPLGGIHSALQLLNMLLPETVLQENEELLTLADLSCRRMQRLIDSLLDVAKMEEHTIKLNLRQIELLPLLEQIAKQQSFALRTRNIELLITHTAPAPPVLADEERLERVIINLLDNAIKYTPQGGRVTVEIAPQTDAIILSVIDTGPGIPADQRERIFERFTQVTDNHPRLRGFGLGLTFCKLTIEAHGGRIWIEPGPNNIGSRFMFTLPRRQQVAMGEE